MLKAMLKGSGKHPNKIEICLGISLWNLLGNKYQYTGNGTKIIGGKCPDFVMKDSKKIIELYGDYWHCNPNKYESNYFNSRIGKTAQEIWRADVERIKIFKTHGYDTLIIWEKELKNIKQVEQKIIEFI